MSIPTPPYVAYKSVLAPSCRSSEVVLLKAESACIVDSLIVTNTSLETQPIQVFAQVETLLANAPVRVFIGKGIPLAPNATQDILEGRCFYLQPGDTLLVYSDASSSILDALVSYRELFELKGI